MSSWKEFYKNESINYDRIRYDYWYGNIFSLLHESALSEMLKNYMPKSVILDVASGTGHNLAALSRSGGAVMALDLTSEMLLESRKKIWHSSVAYIIGDAFCLPFPDNCFDVVSSSRFLHLFSEKQQQIVMIEMIRVLKPGGLIIIDFYNIYSWIIFYPIIIIYRILKCKRPTKDTRNSVSSVHKFLLERNLSLNETIGVGSYLLYFARFLPEKFAIKLGEFFKNKPCRFLSEQFIVSAQK